MTFVFLHITRRSEDILHSYGDSYLLVEAAFDFLRRLTQSKFCLHLLIMMHRNPCTTISTR